MPPFLPLGFPFPAAANAPEGSSPHLRRGRKRTLTVQITHPSIVAAAGTTSRRSKSKNGSFVTQGEYKSQPDSGDLFLRVSVEAAPGDVLEAKAICSIFGSKTGKADRPVTPCPFSCPCRPDGGGISAGPLRPDRRDDAEAETVVAQGAPGHRADRNGGRCSWGPSRRSPPSHPPEADIISTPHTWLGVLTVVLGDHHPDSRPASVQDPREGGGHSRASPPLRPAPEPHGPYRHSAGFARGGNHLRAADLWTRSERSVFLPATPEELRALGWDRLDVILVTGDSYLDSPFVGVSVIGQWLLKAGYRVGIIAQPDVDIGGGHHPPRRTGPLLGRDGRLHRLAGRQPHRLGKEAPGGRLHRRGDQQPPPRPGGDRLRQPDPALVQGDQTDRPGRHRGEPPADRPLRRLVEPRPPLHPDRRQGRSARLRHGGKDGPGDSPPGSKRDGPFRT